MTISTLQNKVIASGNGATTSFSFGFAVRSAADLSFIYTDSSGNQTTLLASQVNVVLNAIPAGQIWAPGGSVTYPLSGSPIASGTTLTILRTVPYSQTTSLINQGGFYPDVLEIALDFAEMQIQQVAQQVGNSIQAPAVDSAPVMILPAAAVRANGVLAFDQNGNVAIINKNPSFFTSLSASSGSSLVGFIQSGTGAVARTVQSKERDIVSVKDFGAVGDGVTDDTTAIQNAATQAATFGGGAILYFPPSSGFYKITAPISITAAMRIIGSGQYTSGLICIGVNGFNLATGALRVSIESISIYRSVRYTLGAPNTNAGINIIGTSGTHSTGIILRDVYIDGFQQAVLGAYVYASLFDNVRAAFCKHGLWMTGTSVNNNVIANQFDISNNDGTGISIGDGTGSSEGWIISDTVIFGGNTGVQLNGGNNNKVRGCIIDTFTNVGILTTNLGTAAATNNRITDNYIGSASANHGIRLFNSQATAQSYGNYVAGNEITAVGGSLTNGILADGSQESNNIITSNNIKATTRDINIQNGSNWVIHGNQMSGGGFATTVNVTYNDNLGVNNTSINFLSDVSGLYTPTITNVTNLTSSAAYVCQYSRKGSVVTVSGKVDMNPTSAANTALGISLPIPSVFTLQNDLGGVAFSPAVAGMGAGIFADTANARAQLQFIDVTTGNNGWYFTFTYNIK